MTLRDIAALLNAEIEGSGTAEIRRVAKIEEAGDGDITFIANPKYARHLATTRASAVIVGKDLKQPDAASRSGGPVLVRVRDPYLSFLKVLLVFQPQSEPLPPGIHPSAVVDAAAALGVGVRIGAHTVISPGCRIGDNTVLSHGVVLGEGVEIGPDSLLYPHVIVRERCRIGARVIIHPGAVIGSDGFGFAPKADGSYEKIPQVGIVVIEDDVEIGANTTIDRATMGETRIRRGAKLDNLIQVAHNVLIGENTVIAAQAGISGSTKIGRGVMVGGQVGFTGHLEIADGTKFGAQSGVHRSAREAGETYFGTPAVAHREAMRLHGALGRLPDLIAMVHELKATVDRLAAHLRASSTDIQQSKP